jgi:hypothetical protein
VVLMILGLLICALFPQVVMWLPNLIVE